MGWKNEGLQIKEFVPGICFICGKPCDLGFYVHNDCAHAYSDEKEKRVKEALKDAPLPY